ncbi:MAG: hypothetical protein DMG23_10385, partial [Acidobacteria bacterium]
KYQLPRVASRPLLSALWSWRLERALHRRAHYSFVIREHQAKASFERRRHASCDSHGGLDIAPELR